MIKKKLDNLIFDRIKKGHIAPRPKWHFLLKDSVVWVLGVLALAVGTMATSVIMYLLAYNDWTVYEEMSESFLSFVLLSMPYFWLIIFVLFAVAVYFNIKHTKKGYKYSLLVIIVVSVSVSLLGGGLLFATGAGQAIDDILGEKFSVYHKVINPHIDKWNKPSEGRLVGLIVKQIDNSNFILVDLRRQEWELNCLAPCVAGMLEVGRPTKVLGQAKGSVFVADRVMNMGPGRGQFMRPQFKSRLPLLEILKKEEHILESKMMRP